MIQSSRELIWRKRFSRIGFSFAVAAILFYCLFPFYWAIVSSLKTGTSLFKVEYIPDQIQFENYKNIFIEQNFAQSLWNSFLVATSTVLISLALSILAAFALSRVSFRGRSALLMTILSISMFPQIALLSGMYELIRWMGLYNHVFALTVSYMVFTLPFTVWVITTFMKELPKELEECARLDGCSQIKIVTQVFMPLMKPAMVTTGLLAFMKAWNEFLFALTLVLSSDKRTVPVAISFLSGQSQYELPWGSIMAASVTVTVPLIILVLIFQKRIVSGLTAGAVKG